LPNQAVPLWIKKEHEFLDSIQDLIDDNNAQSVEILKLRKVVQNNAQLLEIFEHFIELIGVGTFETFDFNHNQKPLPIKFYSVLIIIKMLPTDHNARNILTSFLDGISNKTIKRSFDRYCQQQTYTINGYGKIRPCKTVSYHKAYRSQTDRTLD